MTSTSPQFIVVDSTVLLHDPLVITRFPQQTVVIAAGCIFILQTIGSQTSELARNARQAALLIEQTVHSSAGVEIGAVSGGVFIDMTALDWQPNNFASAHVDAANKSVSHAGRDASDAIAMDGLSESDLHRRDDGTLVAATRLTQRIGVDSVLLLSRDAARRALGRAMHVHCQHYELHGGEELHADSGLIIVDSPWPDAAGIAAQVGAQQQIPKSAFAHDQHFAIGQIVVHAADDDALALVIDQDHQSIQIRSMHNPATATDLWGLKPRNVEQAAVLGALCDPDIDLVSVLGDAGTGKTLLALAAGLHLVFDKEQYSEVLVTRATVAVGDDIGFLPGTEEEKMHPWMGAIEDSLDILLPNASDQAGRFGKASSHDLLRHRIKIRSMSFMRGRTFSGKYVIIDEAQNLTPHEMRMMITRAGKDTKVVCLGNMQQIDTPWLSAETSGLTWLQHHFDGWPHSARIVLQQVERSRLADRAGLNTSSGHD